MQYTSAYRSPLGDILLAGDENALTGLWFEGAKYYARGLEICRTERETPVLIAAKHWLDVYFSGREPDFMPPLQLTGTPFERSVWKILQTIPYGTTVTYGEISGQIAEKRGLDRLSAQAVGGAVGRNPISVLIPCHRVVGSDGSLKGYAGGVDKKAALLRLEGAWTEKNTVPVAGTAL